VDRGKGGGGGRLDSESGSRLRVGYKKKKSR